MRLVVLGFLLSFLISLSSHSAGNCKFLFSQWNVDIAERANFTSEGMQRTGVVHYFDKNGKAIVRFNFEGFEKRAVVTKTDDMAVGDFLRIKLDANSEVIRNVPIKAEVISNLGKELDANEDSNRVYEDSGIVVDYSIESIAQAKEIIEKYNVNNNHLFEGGRKDERDTEFVTIDGPTTIDRDDAIHVSRLANGNFKIKVAVPDLTENIPLASPLGQHMISRSTSHYLKENVWHLLPTELTIGVLSIDPQKTRQAWVFEMELTPNAKPVDLQIKQAVVRSRKAYTYEEIQGLMDAHKKGKETQFNDMFDLYREMTINGHKYLSLPVSFEKEFKLNAQGIPESVRDFKGLEANDLIEKFMILTNMTVAEWMHENDIPGAYRGQTLPKKDKVASALANLRSFGLEDSISFTGGMQQVFKKAFAAIATSKYPKLFSSMMLQSTMAAENLPSSMKHFFLNANRYAFMTSPIRRSADYWNQHMIKLFLEGGAGAFNGDINYRDMATVLTNNQNVNMKKAKSSEVRWSNTKLLRLYDKEIKIGDSLSSIIIKRKLQAPMVYIPKYDMNVRIRGFQSTPMENKTNRKSKGRKNKNKSNSNSDRSNVLLSEVIVVEKDLLSGSLIVEMPKRDSSRRPR